MTLRCYWCQSDDLEPCEETLWASDESIVATHECRKCHRKFRRTEPDGHPAMKETNHDPVHVA